MNSQDTLPSSTNQSGDDASVAASSPAGQLGDSLGRTLPISVDRLLEFVTAQAADQVTKRVSEIESRRFRNFTMAVTLAGFLGVGTVAWIANLFIDQKVATATAEATKNLSEQLKFEVAYQQLVALALSLEAADSFSNTDRDSAMELLREIGHSPFYRTRPGFSAFLSRVIESFAAADLRLQILEIDELFRPALSTNSKTALAMATHYGTVLLGSPLPLARLSKEEAALIHYADAANSMNMPWLHTFWNLTLEFQKNGLKTNTTTDQLAAACEALEPDEKATFEKAFYLFSDPKRYMSEPNEDGRRVAQRMALIGSAYPKLKPKLNTDDDVDPQHLKDLLEGLSELSVAEPK